MPAYYNEIDPYAAQWIRNLISAGHIAPGDVDERGIEDVKADDLKGYTQCHFFAGIGVWSLALRRAGWADDRPIWTGSCPCQPFSASGKQSGFADERHLWPHWHWLIQECRPPVIAGEQVASKAAEPWFDLVQADLEVLGYAFGCVPFPAAGVGAPNLRDRAYWVGYASGQGLPARERQTMERTGWRGEGRTVEQPSGPPDRLANASGPRREEQRGPKRERKSTRSPRLAEGDLVGGLADTSHQRIDRSRDARPRGRVEHSERRSVDPLGDERRPGPTNGFWRDADWLFCRDGKWRPVEPGTFPLAHGSPARVGRLRAYGNAINAEAATVFMQSVKDIFDEQHPTST